ncbi:flavin reductase family protein [Pseudomonas typographi]|nr:flavin reductase family protein [Pseudomonas typographi]
MQQATILDANLFRQAMASFASGVTAVTTQENNVPCGLIATSVCSLSAEPPTVLVCVNKSASPHDAILRTRCFAVNLLSAEQASIVERFSAAKGSERFEPEQWTLGVTGAPVLIDSVVTFDCELIAVHDGFTHSIMVGKIVDAMINERQATACLLWHRQGFAHSSLKPA